MIVYIQSQTESQLGRDLGPATSCHVVVCDSALLRARRYDTQDGTDTTQGGGRQPARTNKQSPVGTGRDAVEGTTITLWRHVDKGVRDVDRRGADRRTSYIDRERRVRERGWPETATKRQHHEQTI